VWAPLAGLDEATRAARALSLAGGEVSAHPGRAMSRALARVPDALEPDRIFLGVARRGQFPARDPRLLTALGLAIALVTLVPMVLALSSVLVPPPGALPRAAAAAFVAALLVQVLTIAHPRFTQPAWILLVVPSAMAWAGLRAGNHARLVATVSAGLVLAAIALRQLTLG
jgi:hypothetical protein